MLLALLILAGMATQEPRPAAVAHDTPARLAYRPNLQEAMPETAVHAAVSGRATIDCRATVTGVLADCRVFEETPAGWGFGEAALTSLRHVPVRPAALNGEPVELWVRQVVEFIGVGSVDLDCALGPDGGASDCRVIEELPAGRGLGALALAEAADTPPPHTATRQARNGRFIWRMDVTAPLEDCPVVDGQPRCGAP